MRQPPDYFGDIDLDLIYIAKRLREAKRLEDVLTQAGFQYVVEPDSYKGGIIFQSERIGAFFYVAPEATAAAHETMAKAGYKPYRTD